MKSTLATLSTLLVFASPLALASQTSTSVDDSSVIDSTGPMPDASASSTSESGVDKVLGDKKFDENSEITDAQLKANAGSLSRYSLRFNLSYYGPSPSNLGELNQPNPDGVVSQTQTAISGNIGFRYRLDNSTSISVYAGLSDDYAFHPNQSLDVNSPTVSWDKTFKWEGIQFLSSPGVTLITQSNYTAAGEAAGLTYLLSAVYSIGKSGWAVGSDNTLGYYFFDRDYVNTDGKVRRTNVGLTPYVKYNFTENFNASTATALTLYNLRQDAYTSFGTRTIYQKLGVGYAFTRDIYVAPYLMFYPSDMTMATTTVNLSTSFSIL
jgi:hypothetical protein